MTDFKGTLLLNRSELSTLMDLDDYIEGIENAFKMHGIGKSFGTGMIHGDTPGDLEFHIKVGGLKLKDNLYFGLKINASSFLNMERYNLPNIMGAIMLFDAEKGIPLAIVDSIDPTIKRTGAATAVAAKYFAKKNSTTATICGCGTQGRIQLQSLMKVCALTKVYAFDQKISLAEKFSQDMSSSLGIEVIASENLKESASSSQIIVTCTPSKSPFLMKDYVSPGTFIAAVGGDSPDKQELESSLMKGNKVVVDILEQCMEAGELHHGIDQGYITPDDVHATIGEVISGKKTARESEEEIIIYDATGTALQDTAAAALCYEKAIQKGMGKYVNFYE